MNDTSTTGSQAAIDVCDRMFTSIDLRDWDAFERCLAPTVITDFTQLWGGESDRTSAHDLRTSWSALFAGFTATQHLITNYQPSRATAGIRLRAAFRATHFGVDPFGSPSWTLYGTYLIDLEAGEDSYRVNAIRQSPTAGEGNRNIVLLAVSRAAEG